MKLILVSGYAGLVFCWLSSPKSNCKFLTTASDTDLTVYSGLTDYSAPQRHICTCALGPGCCPGPWGSGLAHLPNACVLTLFLQALPTGGTVEGVQSTDSPFLCVPCPRVREEVQSPNEVWWITDYGSGDDDADDGSCYFFPSMQWLFGSCFSKRHSSDHLHVYTQL